MESAIFGLVGVIVGAALGAAKEWWLDSRRQQKDVTYLSIQVVFLLDRFVAGCIEVIRDDGLSYGSRDEDGCKSPQVNHPTFDPTTIDVEWKALPSNLMYEILNFPLLIEKSNSHIAAAVEYEAGPPDYEEFFEARTMEFSELGLQALKLATTLREQSNLPSSPESDEIWDRKEILTKAKQETIELIEKRRRISQEAWERINGLKENA